jgi:CheY-like chemotaxis protein
MSVKKVLVVDDSPTERHAISEILRKAGYEVNTCDSGEEAVVQSKMLLPDLILMDVVMPGLNGFQATRVIARDIFPLLSALQKVKKLTRYGVFVKEHVTTLLSQYWRAICLRKLADSNSARRMRNFRSVLQRRSSMSSFFVRLRADLSAMSIVFGGFSGT